MIASRAEIQAAAWRLGLFTRKPGPEPSRRLSKHALYMRAWREERQRNGGKVTRREYNREWRRQEIERLAEAGLTASGRMRTNSRHPELRGLGLGKAEYNRRYHAKQRKARLTCVQEVGK